MIIRLLKKPGQWAPHLEINNFMMKTLLLTRHAKTVQGNGQMRDFDRFLAPRGPKDVLLVANEMKTSGRETVNFE